MRSFPKRTPALRPLDLIDTASLLVASKKKPSQANLRRAVSTVYYALFHCLARSCADLMIGSTGADRSKHAWQQAYRAMDHAFAKSACKNDKITQFPQPIEDFANAFVTMQEKRHLADYDPFENFTKSAVTQDIATVKQTIIDFGSAPIKDRRAFCAFVLFKRR